MNVVESRCLRVVLAAALASLMVLCSAAAEAAPPGLDAATEKIREILREDRGDSGWGADPPAEEIAVRGEPFAATVLSGAGHAMLLIGEDGRPRGSHLRLLHVSVEGDRAWVNECVLRLGRDEDRSCPPPPFALVDCATWSVPAEAARTAALTARAALFVRVYEKKFISGPSEEFEDGTPVVIGVSGGFTMSTADFVAVANVMESGKPPLRVAEEWAGYPSSKDTGRYVRADAAAAILREAFPRPSDAPASNPPPVLHAELSRLFATLPLDAEFWGWVRERMVLMTTFLGLPADLARLEKYLTPESTDPSALRTRAYALEALARRTGRDTRCDGGRRLADDAAAALWVAKSE
jgi:hypothetical protein